MIVKGESSRRDSISGVTAEVATSTRMVHMGLIDFLRTTELGKDTETKTFGIKD